MMEHTKKTRILSKYEIPLAAQLLLQGELVAFPTETVYGLGAPAFQENSVAKIFISKGRPADNPLIVHIASLSSVQLLAREIPPIFWKLAEAFFPGPLTVILPKHPSLPSITSGGLDSVAFRMPDHKIALELIKEVGTPLAAPSANCSGKPSSTSVQHVLEDLDGKIAAILDDSSSQTCALGIESTVLSLLNPARPVLLRPGSLTQEAIEEVLKQQIETVSKKGAHVSEMASSPGMRYRHYAPKASVFLLLSQEEFFSHPLISSKKALKLVSDGAFFPPERPVVESFFSDWRVLHARNLYECLRLADSKGFSEILIFCDPKLQSDKSLMNRLLRSANLL